MNGNHPHRLRLARWRGRSADRLQGTGSTEPIRARRGHLYSAPTRSDAVLSFCLPRRHVRLLRDDGERRGALDLPHAYRQGGARRRRRDPTAGQPAGHQGPRGRFRPPPRAEADFARVPPDSAERRAADEAIECIGCGVCYASCEVLAWNPSYLGPAALNRAWSLVNDVRDAGNDERLRAVAGDAGCHACHSHQACTLRCPKALDPTASIAGLKRATLRAALRGKL